MNENFQDGWTELDPLNPKIPIKLSGKTVVLPDTRNEDIDRENVIFIDSRSNPKVSCIRCNQLGHNDPRGKICK